MSGHLFRVEVQSSDDTVVIRCAGELDLSVAETLRRAIDRACTAKVANLRIDTVDLTFIDSTGLSCLLEAHRRCDEVGAALEVIPSPPVARLLDLTAAPIRRREAQRRTFLRIPRPKREGG
jgi:anti-sigma B factor antagonist